jgi:nucleolar complex protein 2
MLMAQASALVLRQFGRACPSAPRGEGATASLDPSRSDWLITFRAPLKTRRSKLSKSILSPADQQQNANPRKAHTVATMPVSKSTKKFEKNKLGDVLKARKNVAKIKQRKQMDAKKKQRKAADNAKAEDLEDGAAKKPKKSGKEDNFGDMSMDQFFEGGFDIPKMKKTKSKTGKRKRTPVEEDASEGSSDEDMADATANGDDDDVSASDSESGDDAETHKRDIENLKKNDPEFYKYLESNDKELLDFEDDDLAEMDALSASEDEATPRKKQKKAGKAEPESDEESEAATGNEVSKQLIQKWKSAMETKSSLRAMKEVVLAFRSAAHLNDEEGKAYKYSIADPDGMLRPLHPSCTSDTVQSITRFSFLPSHSYPRS